MIKSTYFSYIKHHFQRYLEDLYPELKSQKPVQIKRIVRKDNPFYLTFEDYFIKAHSVSFED
ncbi:MAG TPA: hypothetical protein DDW27_08840 [Bacteroidales bacterium]|nr:hypothetical protein [Bacteroidales bacterium]